MPPIPSDTSAYAYGGGATEPQARIRIAERVGLDPVILIKEAAAIAGCHPDTLKYQASKGKLTLLKISTRRLGVRRSELDRFLKGCVWAAA